MEREHGDVAVGHRLLHVAAVAVLASAGALGVGRVFQGTEASLKLLAAALLSVGVAALLQRRGPIVAVLGSAVGLLLTVSVLVFPDTLYGIFPTARTFSEIGRSIHEVSQQARVQVAPTVPLRPLLLAAMTAVWAASFASHALAMRSGSPLLAALPPASLLAFADITLEDGARPQFAALFLIGALAVLFMDGLRRVRQWGPLHPWSSQRRRIMSPTATRGARRLALIALGAALLIPGVLPGYQRAGLLRLDTGPASSTPTINPLVSVTASLHLQHPLELFVVQSNHPDYWRWMSLDKFNGTTWTTDDLDVGKGATVPAGGVLAPDPLDSINPDVHTVEVQQSFAISQPPGQWLPMAFRADSVAVGKSSIRYDPITAAAVPLVGSQPGLQYSVTSTVVEPTRADLENIPQSDFDVKTHPEFLPDELLPQTAEMAELRQIARDETAGEATPFEKVLAIQQYLANGDFTYDQRVSGAYDVKTLLNFLTHTKRGFCQQFASAMAVLVRSLGYPARVATGFTPGRYDAEKKLYVVSTDNAHTWVEVLFPGYGWIPFEPTPTRTNPVASYLGTGTGCLTGACGPSGQQSGGKTSGQKVAGKNRAYYLDQNVTRPTPSRVKPPHVTAPPERSTQWVYPVALLLLAIALFVFLIVLPIWKTVRRRLEVARAKPGRDLILAEFDAFTGRASDLGLARRRGETLREYRDRLRTRVRFSDGHIDRLTATVARAAYGADPVTGEEAKEAVAASRRAIKEMRRGTPLRRRITGVFRPGR
jgi:transglutaminase-like putative cysteine protease